LSLLKSAYPHGTNQIAYLKKGDPILIDTGKKKKLQRYLPEKAVPCMVINLISRDPGYLDMSFLKM
jgi:hypothetical protein